MTFVIDGDTLIKVRRICQRQFPGTCTMAKGESRTGLLIFEVPDGKQELSLSYMEAFDDDSTGDTFL